MHMASPEDGDNAGGRRFGKAVWIIVGGIAALALAFAAIASFGPAIFPNSREPGPDTETAEESATSGPGHNTTSVTQPPSSADLGGNIENSTEQIPDSELAYGRETSTLSTPENVTANP
jgi:hypothetical protein